MLTGRIKPLCLAFFCLCAVNLQAQQPPRLAITEFVSDLVGGKRVLEDMTMIRVIMCASLAESGIADVLYPDEADRVIKEKGISLREIFQKENCDKLLERGVRFVITGFLKIENDKYRIDLSVLDVEEGEFFCNDFEIIERTPRAVSNGAKAIASRMILAINASGVFNRRYPAKYKIGDRGPGGGIIFFVKSRAYDGWRYLEAAPANTEFKAGWGFYFNGYYWPEADDTQAGLGTGYKNTINISERIFGEVSGGSAAEICRMLKIGKYYDWYLPSKEELFYMYENLAKKGLGGFSGDSYWSSTQSTERYAWFQTFNDGKQYYNGLKTNHFKVRAIRAF